MEQVARTGSTDPVIEGDQLVSLNWERIDDARVVGYAIYRSQDSSTFDKNSPIDIVYKSQLGGALPDVDCPVQFSANNPGYCDISVTNGEKYYYKIAAVKSGDIPGGLSVVMTAELSLQRPTLISPGNVTALNVTDDAPLFMWQAVNGNEISYIITLVDTETGITIWQPTVTGSSAIPTKQYDGPALGKGKSYNWTARAVNKNGQSESSQTFRFTKQENLTKPEKPNFCGGTYCSPQQTDAYAVDDAANTVTIYWEKSTATNISHYNIYRCKNQSGICNTLVATVGNYACSATKTKVACYVDSNLERGANYYYDVAAVDTQSAVSDLSQTIQVTLLFKSVSLLYPAYDQTVNVPTPTFTFLGMPGATIYNIQLLKKPASFTDTASIIWSYTFSDSGSTAIFNKVYNEDGTAKTPLLNPSDPTTSGTQYQWRVCTANAAFPNIKEQCSNPWQFFKNLQVPAAVSPRNGEQLTYDEIVFTWGTVPGAESYQFRLCKRTGTGSGCGTNPIVVQETVSDNSYTLSGISLDICQKDVDPTCSVDGAYYWETRAVDEYGAVSGNWLDSSNNCLNCVLFYRVSVESPMLIAPANGVVIAPSDGGVLVGTDYYGDPAYIYNIVLQWTVLQQASAYIVKIEDITATDDGGVPVVLYEGELAVNSKVPVNLASGRKFRWNVAVSGTPFVTANARVFYTGLPYPHLQTPGNGQQVMLQTGCNGMSSTLCMHFAWNGGTVETTGGATTEIPAVIGASSYDIEILKNGMPFLCEPEFIYDPASPPTLSFTNTPYTFCDLSTPSVVNGDVFTWRVRSRDITGELTATGIGYPSEWSQYRTFVVLIPPVVLSSPPDSSAVCDPYNDPDNILLTCTTVACQDLTFYWSPIPGAAGNACYRIDVSDSEDFNNIVWTDNTESPKNSFPCDNQACYKTEASSGKYIPMTNGVVYYWRVGASVKPSEGGTCGSTWVYSDTWEFFKRPPYPNIQSVTAGIYSAAISWTPPTNCTSASGQALSTPGVPPGNGGQYIIYLETQMPDDANPPTHVVGIVGSSNTSYTVGNLQPDTDYSICMATVDASYITNSVGNVSNFVCMMAHTQVAEE